MSVRVLFVCLGNICRSPTAEGVFRKLAAEEAAELKLDIDSAGTADYHVGEPPDPRAQAAARQRGVEISGLRARQFEPQDLQRFDYVLAMDRSNLTVIRRAATVDAGKAQVGLFLEFAPEQGMLEVPDPYFGGEAGFDRVLDLIEAASRGLLAHIRERQS